MNKILFWSAVISVSLFLESANAFSFSEWFKGLFGGGTAATTENAADAKAPEVGTPAPAAAENAAESKPEASTPAPAAEGNIQEQPKVEAEKKTAEEALKLGEEVLKLDDAESKN
ncbi:hypothetical protein FACS1894122_04230 [Alphaproteobacteria bacterium]|nr:hypothetical protein FACS1894122_04230 [Alphaproteobacteria bacterium]